MPITMRINQQDEFKYWLETQKRAQSAGRYVKMPTVQEAADELVRRMSRKLYGTSKYKPTGEKYTRDERPWLFE